MAISKVRVLSVSSFSLKDGRRTLLKRSNFLFTVTIFLFFLDELRILTWYFGEIFCLVLLSKTKSICLLRNIIL